MLNIECSYAKIRFSFLKQLRGIIDNKPQLRQYFDRIYSELRKTTSELVNYSLSIVNYPLSIYSSFGFDLHIGEWINYRWIATTPAMITFTQTE